MKNFFTYIFFILPQFLAAQHSDLEKAGLKGLVHTIKLMPEEMDKAGNLFKRSVEFTTYNRSGIITELHLLDDATLNVIQEVKYEYNNGLLMKRTDDMKVSLLSGISEERYSYNTIKQLLEIQTFEGETGAIPVKLTHKKTFCYDVKGNRTEEKQVDISLNNIESITRYSYDDSGNPIRIGKQRYGMQWQYTEYTYDINNRVQTETLLDDEGRKKSTLTYKYDDDGNNIRIEELNYAYPATTVLSKSITNHSYSKGRLVNTNCQTNTRTLLMRISNMKKPIQKAIGFTIPPC